MSSTRQDILSEAMKKIQALGSCKVTHGKPARTRRAPTLEQRVKVQVDAACAEVKGHEWTEQEQGEP